MLRIIVYILVLTMGMIGSSVFAGSCANEGNITQSDFKLDLGCMDPLNEGDNISGLGGKEVLLVFLGKLSDFLLFTIPIIAAVSFLAAGYFYIFSAGDSEKVGRAKTIIKWNIIAIMVALLSYGIIKLIANLFTPT